MAVRARKSILSALWPRGIVAQGTYIASKPIRNNDAFGRPFFFVPHCRVVVAAAAAARTVVRVRIIYLDERKTTFFFFPFVCANVALGGRSLTPSLPLAIFYMFPRSSRGVCARDGCFQTKQLRAATSIRGRGRVRYAPRTRPTIDPRAYVEPLVDGTTEIRRSIERCARTSALTIQLILFPKRYNYYFRTRRFPVQIPTGNIIDALRLRAGGHPPTQR